MIPAFGSDGYAVGMLRFLILPVVLSAPAAADPPRIEGAVASRAGDQWRISVTLSHPDTGWDHYADGWRVLDESGAEIGPRVLHHPHVDEQPFTRSLGSVAIPDGADTVLIEARCNRDGWTGNLYRLTLP